jgi:hypothetical protein
LDPSVRSDERARWWGGLRRDEPIPGTRPRRLAFAAAALLFGLVLSLPYWGVPLLRHLEDAEGTWSPFAVRGQDFFEYDGAYYAAVASRFAQGRVRLAYGDAFCREHRDDPGFWPGLAMLPQGVAYTLAGDPARGQLALTILLASVSFWLTARVAHRLSGDAWIAVATAAFLVVANELVTPILGLTPPSRIVDHLVDQASGVRPLKYFGRTPYLLVSFPLFLLGWFLAHRALVRGGLVRVVAAGAVLGVQFYVYFYYWTVMVTGLALLFLWAAVIRDGRCVRRLLAVCAIAAVVSIPYWLNILRLSEAGLMDTVRTKQGVEWGRDPLLSHVKLYLPVLVVGFLLTRRSAARALLCAVVAASILCLNAQVVTGYSLQYYHWKVTVLAPATVLLAASILGRFVSFLARRWPHRRAPVVALRAASAALFVALAAFAALVNVSFVRAQSPHLAFSADEEAALGRLAREIEEGDTVLALSAATNLALPTRTGAYVYLPIRNLSTTPLAEVEERVLIALRLLGFPRSSVRELLTPPGLDSYYSPYRRGRRLPPAVWERTMFEFAYFSEGPYLDRRRDAMLASYDRILEEPVAGLLDRHAVAFLWVGETEARHGGPVAELGERLEPILQRESVTLYRIR